MTEILGWYGHQNIGDESYKLSFPKVFPKQTFSFNDPKCTELQTGTCILGGGDILNEMYVKKLLSVEAARRMAISISANINSPLALLKQLDGIYIRDQRSLKFLQGHGVDLLRGGTQRRGAREQTSGASRRVSDQKDARSRGLVGEKIV